MSVRGRGTNRKLIEIQDKGGDSPVLAKARLTIVSPRGQILKPTLGRLQGLGKKIEEM